MHGGTNARLFLLNFSLIFSLVSLASCATPPHPAEPPPGVEHSAVHNAEASAPTPTPTQSTETPPLPETTALGSHLGKRELGDLDRILKTRYLRILTTKNPYEYFIFRGQTKGLQYEMASEFTKYLNAKYNSHGKLRIVFEIIPVDFDQLIPMLNEGFGDIVAVGMTPTPEREAAVSFTVPYQNVDEVIVTRKELAKEPWKGKTFHVQKDSGYLETLAEHPDWVKTETVDPNLNAADVMELISLKKYDYTLASSFWAETISGRFGNLAVLKERPFKRNVPISWAVRKNNPLLLKELNEFLPTVKNGTLLGNTYRRKYFRDFGRIRSRDFNLATSKLSRYDKLLKKYAEEFGFDWRFLAAVCYQESKFRQALRNSLGAVGLFQIKQETASEPYIAVPEIEGAANSENNIHAGVKYLAWLKKTYLDSLPNVDEAEKLRMMLAAYNAGPNRLLQAIHRAKKERLDPNRWFRNVELAMAEMGIAETVIYVSEINKHYLSYVLLGIH